METFITIIAPLILSGLAFLTYKHPPVARKILGALFVVNILYFVTTGAFYFGKIGAYIRSEGATMPRVTNIKKEYETTTAFRGHPDSAKLRSEHVEFIVDREATVHDTIRNRMRLIREADTGDITPVKFSTITIITLLVLYILSFLFDGIWKARGGS